LEGLAAGERFKEHINIAYFAGAMLAASFLYIITIESNLKALESHHFKLSYCFILLYKCNVQERSNIALTNITIPESISASGFRISHAHQHCLAIL